MKKITLFVCSLFFVSLNFGQVLISENFETGLAIPTGWVDNDIASNGEIWTFVSGGEAPGFTAGNTFLYDFGNLSGNYAIFNSDAYGDNGTAENSALTSPAFNCSTCTSVVITFSHFILTDFGGTGFVEVYDGTTWVEITEYSETTIPENAGGNHLSFGNVTFDVSTQLAGVSNAQIRFRWTGNWSFFWTIDNIIVQQLTSIPNSAVNPFPSDTTVDVAIDTSDGPDLDTDPDNSVVFAWENDFTGAPATSYDFYLGLSPTSLNFLGNTSFNIVNISGMQYSTLYYWQVVARNEIGVATSSSVWSLTTEANPALSTEENQIKTLKIYPNPVLDFVTIDTNAIIDGISVINQLGQNVLEIEKKNILNNKVNLKSLPKGAYFLNIKSEDKVQSIKIIKE